MSTTYHNKSLFVNVALVLITFAYIYHTIIIRMEVFGVGTTHKNVNTSDCSAFGKDIPQVQGCESIQVDPRTNLVYMACGNRGARTRWLEPTLKYNTAYEKYSDHVLVMDEKNNLKSLKVMEVEDAFDGKRQLVPFKMDFRIHGFDIYWDNINPTELTFMFVNHQKSGDGISIFSHRIGTDYIQYVRTVKSPLLYSPNDVVATSRTTFYATNDMKNVRGFLRKFEILLGMPWGHVVHYGETGVFTKAYNGISYPNGIARSPDGSVIYVAASSEPSVNMFRPKPDGSLELVSKKVFRNFVPDNISVDVATGHLLVAGLLNTFEMFRYNREVLHGTSAQPAASIRRLIPSKSLYKGFTEEEVLVHDGRLLPSTTVAAMQGKGNTGRIILGSVMADHIAICKTDSRKNSKRRASLIWPLR